PRERVSQNPPAARATSVLTVILEHSTLIRAHISAHSKALGSSLRSGCNAVLVRFQSRFTEDDSTQTTSGCSASVIRGTDKRLGLYASSESKNAVTSARATARPQLRAALTPSLCSERKMR